ncbi:conserved protein of unknown function [uncultured Sphingopyxis sp.]|uniref:Uncharacterized protein n=1 Tax=uncultured Sphingopyxis sp. TaxID=310581 RepID=A0A1Y5PX57_9SPHN|nr:hypothetical protein [uncultured Sphingopyxis sp.]SBV31814.1 conserved protein of unknown function [uncultured Sphingopyxis sp.]
MSSFSIDLAADRIVDSRTRAYFEEVSRSYANECFRSSLVMLWTVVVCDLVYKLQTLRDLYNDTAAGKLLQDVEQKRATNPNSPDWEIYLLEEVAKRTKMLETSEFVQLQNLQKLRHLSAHPVLTAADLLFRPTKEDVRAQIRMALEAVLLKPALFSKRVIDTLVDDIATNKALLISREKLKAYLEARYLPNMPLAIELELFRVLWKFCFRLNNADTEANRGINAQALAILFNRDPVAVRTMIGAERAVFSNVGPDPEPLDALIAFLADHGELFGLLDPAAQILVEGRLAADINNRARGRFKSPDMAAHLDALLAEDHRDLAKLDDDLWLALLDDANSEGQVDGAVRLAIKTYTGSRTYDAADSRFGRFIEPALAHFTSVTMTELLTGIEDNDQTYGRGRSTLDHRQIRDAADDLGVVSSSFKEFTKSL